MTSRPLLLALALATAMGIGAQWTAPQQAVAQRQSTAVGVDTDGSEVAGSIPASGAAPLGAARRDVRRALKAGFDSPAAPPRTVSGTASHVGTRFGRWYLALPEHRWGRPGLWVKICGAGGCITRRSTDAGPDKAMQRAGRVADLNAWDFASVCGCPASRGTTHVTVEYLGALRLPATDTLEGGTNP